MVLIESSEARMSLLSIAPKPVAAGSMQLSCFSLSGRRIILRDRLLSERPFRARAFPFLKSLLQPVISDGAVYDDMGDVNPLGPVLAGHALRDHAQAGLGDRKVRKPSLPRNLPEAPVKISVPRPSESSRRSASRPTRKME